MPKTKPKRRRPAYFLAPDVIQLTDLEDLVWAIEHAGMVVSSNRTPSGFDIPGAIYGGRADPPAHWVVRAGIPADAGPAGGGQIHLEVS